MQCRCRVDRLPVSEGILVLATLAFATYLAYEFTLLLSITGIAHRPRSIDLDEADCGRSAWSSK